MTEYHVTRLINNLKDFLRKYDVNTHWSTWTITEEQLEPLIDSSVVGKDG